LSSLKKCEDLIAMGVVDEVFSRYLRKTSVSASIVGPADYAAVGAAIRCSGPVGFLIE
jgi:hypothetical protein